jgi:hypothetical protein
VALVAELVDALDLKSRGYFMTVPVRVRPGALNEEDFHILFFFWNAISVDFTRSERT